ncbi:MAG TPA: hypothetical protein VFT82_01490 [Candidatus Paceibacterota bacterium]|nr:hypothetical protein [Candidatus Paceibacterota bacterium]
MKALFVFALLSILPCKADPPVAVVTAAPAKAPLAETEARKKIDSSTRAILIVDGQEYLLLIPREGDSKSTLQKAVAASGLSKPDEAESKAARNSGLDIMKKCLLHNFLLVKKPAQ